jgi:hypothetical protein
LAITPEKFHHMMNTTTASTMMGYMAGMMCDKWGNDTSIAVTEEEIWK